MREYLRKHCMIYGPNGLSGPTVNAHTYACEDARLLKRCLIFQSVALDQMFSTWCIHNNHNCVNFQDGYLKKILCHINIVEHVSSLLLCSLDQATLGLMKTPRCSLPDVSEAEGTMGRRKRSSNPQNKWNKRHLSWRWGRFKYKYTKRPKGYTSKEWFFFYNIQNHTSLTTDFKDMENDLLFLYICPWYLLFSL